MTQGLTNYDAVLKEFYEGSIRETLNNEVVAFKELDESDRQWSGRHVRFPVHTGRNSGVGARGESGTLPTAGNQQYQESRISATYQYGRIQLSGVVLKAGKNAFAEAMATEMDGVTKDLVVDLSRQGWGVGDGRIAQVGAAAASASTITVFNRFFEPGQPGARYFFQGQSIDVGTVASPTTNASSQVISGLAISSDPATTTDTITVTASTLNGSQCESFIFNRGAGGAGIELMGLRGLIDEFSENNIWGTTAFASATVQNISRQTVTQWNAQVMGNSGVERVLDSNILQQAFDKIEIESGLEVKKIWGHHSVVRAMLESVAGDRRYSTPEFSIGGASKLMFEGVRLVRDRHAPFNELYLLGEGVIKMYTLADFAFADIDGAILSRVSGQDDWEAFIRAYKNLGIDGNPKGALVIRDIKTDF